MIILTSKNINDFQMVDIKFLMKTAKSSKYITLYRGLEKKFSDSFPLSKTDAPNGYSAWTDNPELARQYAGENGFVYKIDLPLEEMGTWIVDSNGERALFVNNEKKAGLNGVSGNEYLIYHDHEKYFPNLIKLI